MKIGVVIPTYNEAKVIGGLVSGIQQQGLDVVVVDDGSRDNTSKIAKEAGAIVLENKNNRGKGLVLRQGFDYILKNNYDAVITMDGDGQHHPEDIAYFVQSVNDPDIGMILGNRMYCAKDMPHIRWLTNKFTSKIISWLCKQEIPDSQNGFRFIKREALKNINLYSSKYEIESELIIRISRLGYKIKSIPIRTIYQKTKSQINPFFDTFRFIIFILKELWTLRS